MKWIWLLAYLIAGHAVSAVSVRDDFGNVVTLQKPAQRVIAMAPHVTELLFAAGGGDHIVGVVNYSDYPEAARRIPQIGDNAQVDIERVIVMKPDLLVTWRNGGSQRQLAQLSKLGIPIFYSEPRKLDDIPENLVRLGQLLGTEKIAEQAAGNVRLTLATLKARYANRPTVRVFYQVWDKPLYTLNGQHIVNDAIRLCGGENIFANMHAIAPVVSIEAVLQANPEVIFSTSERSSPDGGVNMWQPYKTMTAVRNGNLMTLNADLINRAGPRMIDGTAQLCEKLEEARSHRPQARHGQ
jgi:iron complex transport system substrate-binding protein